MKLKPLLALLITAHLGSAFAADDPLSAWNDGHAKQAIETWVQETTTANSKNFIPVNQRYVVFDNDGTLWPEAPLTFQLQFVIDEIKRLAPQHPEWKSDALVQAVINEDMKTVVQAGKKGLMQLMALTHSGMTTEEFSQRVSNWVDSHRHARFGCRYDQLGYQPMRQLLDYLRANGFKTWIVSGGGIDFMRVLAEKMYGIPPEQVVGSFSLSEFSLTDNGTQLRKTMNGAFYDDEAMKPVAIHLFMGRRPVGAFGNSDGDVPMLQYTSANPTYKSFGLLVHHTDAAREYAYDAHPPASGKLISGLKLAPQKGWVIVDMKKEWKTVFDPAQCAATQGNQ
ncbi:haloacid dehalogenase-like hydrolase [Pantoea sp. B9002]|uniref:HAD family hydrolase n=1 Tax=Pantoea sp. B9002 TaxID=2726979 RepID=UPI00159F890A|nr:HAD family hydrolase [Pantoea sp. B9002]NWA61542.1 haloacid dehalogenase-like hydrolase [Pantoea sp. B9002]